MFTISSGSIIIVGFNVTISALTHFSSLQMTVNHFGKTFTMQQQLSTPKSLIRTFTLAIPLWIVRG